MTHGRHVTSRRSLAARVRQSAAGVLAWLADAARDALWYPLDLLGALILPSLARTVPGPPAPLPGPPWAPAPRPGTPGRPDAGSVSPAAVTSIDGFPPFRACEDVGVPR